MWHVMTEETDESKALKLSQTLPTRFQPPQTKQYYALPVLVVPQVPVLRAGLECAVHGICHRINGPGVDTNGARQTGGAANKLCGFVWCGVRVITTQHGTA